MHFAGHVIRTVKQRALSTMKTAGVFDFASRSRWRHDRLLILGYHGVSQDDEHRWNPSLFITPDLLERRLAFLRSAEFNILPLAEALARLEAGALPARSVAITFDDGYVDFYRLVHPILHRYQAPATVYLTTYYSEHNLPIPGISAAYMAWKTGRGQLISRAVGEYFTEARDVSPAEKQARLEAFARTIGFPFEEFRRRRILHLMTPAEARAVAVAGVDIQLHTHRHWVPKDEALIRREITDNRARIETITGRPAEHFCYPSGVHYPELLPWLRGLGVRSATTCEPGLATSGQDALLLPRFLDHSGVTQVEFEAWATGVGSVLPRRSAPEAMAR